MATPVLAFYDQDLIHEPEPVPFLIVEEHDIDFFGTRRVQGVPLGYDKTRYRTPERRHHVLKGASAFMASAGRISLRE